MQDVQSVEKIILQTAPSDFLLQGNEKALKWSSRSQKRQRICLWYATIFVFMICVVNEYQGFFHSPFILQTLQCSSGVHNVQELLVHSCLQGRAGLPNSNAGGGLCL